jgi:hypothetical protein
MSTRSDLVVTPFMLDAARRFAADVVAQIHGELDAANVADAYAEAQRDLRAGITLMVLDKDDPKVEVFVDLLARIAAELDPKDDSR